jgi:hypothetical protein
LHWIIVTRVRSDNPKHPEVPRGGAEDGDPAVAGNDDVFALRLPEADEALEERAGYVPLRQEGLATGRHVRPVHRQRKPRCVDPG